MGFYKDLSVLLWSGGHWYPLFYGDLTLLENEFLY
uniref:Uncharacterized protein n=1 Tax=Anguilla anguilla TaxID=7936 RepID=A0A0E9TE97_ANGAN